MILYVAYKYISPASISPASQCFNVYTKVYATHPSVATDGWMVKVPSGAVCLAVLKESTEAFSRDVKQYVL